MTKIRVRFVQAFVERRTGKVYYYFRRRGLPRIPLPGLPGSAEFMAAYQEALAAEDLLPHGPGGIFYAPRAYLRATAAAAAGARP